MNATVKFVQSEKATAARDEIDRSLKRIGCDAVTFTDDIEKCELRLTFQHGHTHVMVPVSARRWTDMFLRLRPWTPENRMSEQHYRENAVRQGLIAISPMLRSWLVGQVIAVENELMTFDRAFFPWFRVNDDRIVAEVALRSIMEKSK